MIIDCFPFFNELDILEIRMNELYDVVDYFVLIEASKTQTFKDKPFYFEENKNKYSKFFDKIIHIKIDSYPIFNNAWGMENYQRNCILNGISKIQNIKQDDIAIISDVDEIISKNTISEIKKSNEDTGLISLDFFLYYMNFKANRKWDAPIYTKLKNLNKNNPQFFRNTKNNFPILKTEKCSGWHFGWMGGIENMYNKMFSCIEPLDKTKIPPYEEYKKIIQNCIKNKKFFNIEYNPNSELMELVDFNNQEYPEFILNNFLKYKNYFYSY